MTDGRGSDAKVECPTCGTAVNGTFRFCSRCGAELRPDAVASIAPYPQPARANFAFTAPGVQRAVAAVNFNFANWWSRVLALVLDGVLVGLPYVVLTSIFGGGTSGTGGGLTATDARSSLVSYAILLVADAIYFTLLNGGQRGQTLGNRAPGIAVRDMRTGGPIGLRRGFLRWFVRAVLYGLLIVPGIVNDLFPLWDPLHQTLADKVVGSVMVKV